LTQPQKAINLIGNAMTIEATKVNFPLQEKIAKKIVQDLALTDSHKIRFGSHAKQRMVENGVCNDPLPLHRKRA
jgi:hypothetical protein